VGANNPYAKYSAANIIVDGSKLEYDVVCPERGSARGHALYAVSSDSFTGKHRNGDGRKRHDDDGSTTCAPGWASAARRNWDQPANSRVRAQK
jgi:hypothetical protein